MYIWGDRILWGSWVTITLSWFLSLPANMSLSRASDHCLAGRTLVKQDVLLWWSLWYIWWQGIGWNIFHSENFHFDNGVWSETYVSAWVHKKHIFITLFYGPPTFDHLNNSSVYSWERINRMGKHSNLHIYQRDLKCSFYCTLKITLIKLFTALFALM